MLTRSSGSSIPLTALVYKSRATERFHAASLGELVTNAQARNAAEGLTGALFYGDNEFVQWLEGPKERLDTVAASINRDRRHTDIEVLSYGSVPARIYPHWQMHLITSTPNDQVLRSKTRTRAQSAYVRAALALVDGDDEPARTLIALPPATVASAVSQCERIASVYQSLWRDDDCGSIDVTLGLSRLLMLFRWHTRLAFPKFRARNQRFLVAPAPEEPHFIGAAFAAELLRESGFAVEYYIPDRNEDLVQRVAVSQPNEIVIATSLVFSRAERAEDLKNLASLVRNAQSNLKPNITIYGQTPMTICGPEIGRVGTRASNIDPQRSALSLAELSMRASNNVLH